MSVRHIHQSAEHEFLGILETIRQKDDVWLCLHAGLSAQLRHEDVIADLAQTGAKLFQHRRRTEEEAKTLLAACGDREGHLIQCADGDLCLLMKTGPAHNMADTMTFLGQQATRLGNAVARVHDLSHDIYALQRVAEQRLVGATRMKAYDTLGDTPRVASIKLRRDRRVDTLALIVEDDHFTAAYASNILNKDYELIHAKTGEEGLAAYIEHAPDIAFLDIHLPGMDGHQTLAAIRAADPDAYVVMLSVDTVASNIKTATELGAAGFLKKPFTKERMLAMVQKSPHFKTGIS